MVYAAYADQLSALEWSDKCSLVLLAADHR
jgi:hypothetical protein